MHPLFGHRIRLALYVLAWLLAGLPLALVVRAVVPQEVSRAHAFAVPLSLLYGFVVMSAWWVCRANPLNGERPIGAVITTQLGAGLQSSAAWCAIGTAWAVGLDRLAGPGPDRAGILTQVLLLFAMGIPLYLLSAIVHYLFLAFEASHAAQRRVLETEVSAREAELRALRAQLNPHFLFNSLNSISALVGTDPEGARRMCERLGDFLRRTLALGARDAVTLGEELELVDRYLAIEQVRFGDRLQVEWELDPRAGSARVPPLFLQPLVENAVKHGVEPSATGAQVRITTQRRGGSVVIQVTNTVPAGQGPRGHGVAQRNVRERLRLLHDVQAQFQASLQDGQYVVRMEVPA